MGHDGLVQGLDGERGLAGRHVLQHVALGHVLREVRVRVVHGRVVEVGLRASVLGAATWTLSRPGGEASQLKTFAAKFARVSTFPRIAAGTARLRKLARGGAAAARGIASEPGPA